MLVTLAASSTHSRTEIISILSDALKVDTLRAGDVTESLANRGLIAGDDAVQLTAVGLDEFERVRRSVQGVTQRLLVGIAETDEIATRRVLDHLRQRAEDELSNLAAQA